MHNEPETKKLLELNERLVIETEMIGWLCTAHDNKVNYQNNPEATRNVQLQLNKASNLICLAYMWALLDEHEFNENNKWIRSNDRAELKAWKHVRHTGAHAPGSRAQRYYNEFNQFMLSSNPGISGLKQNCSYTHDSITLANCMSYRFFEFTKELIKVAIGHCANNSNPV